MKEKFILMLMLMLLPVIAFAGRPIFRSGIQLTTVEEITPDIAWRVSGDIIDNSVYGFSASDVIINDIIICENEQSDVNYYQITNIISQVSNLVCDVIWGTNNTETTTKSPYMGSPSILSRDMKGAFSYPSPSVGSISENLYYNTKDLSIYNLGLNFTNNVYIPTNSVGTNQFKLSEVDQRYVLKNGPDSLTGFYTLYGSLTVTNYIDSETIRLNNIVFKQTDIQTLNSSNIIQPFAYTRIMSSGGEITLTNDIQIETNNIMAGTSILIEGENDSNCVSIIDGKGVALSCGLSFLIKNGDILKLMFNGSLWTELSRLDK